MDVAWTQTQGQPWLVNALAYETCFRGDLAADRSRAVTEADVLEAKERLVRRRDTHLDQLTDKLREDRVRRVIEPLLVGGDGFESTNDDIEYAQDLGLIAQDPPLRMANPIYAEVVPRQLTWATELKIREDPAWFVDAQGALRLEKLLARFQDFFRENAEECKVRHERRGLERTVAEGVEQTAAYMDRCGAEAGHLVVFDRSEDRSWDEKVFRESRPAPSGAEIAVWGM